MEQIAAIQQVDHIEPQGQPMLLVADDLRQPEVNLDIWLHRPAIGHDPGRIGSAQAAAIDKVEARLKMPQFVG